MTVISKCECNICKEAERSNNFLDLSFKLFMVLVLIMSSALTIAALIGIYRMLFK